MGLKRKKSHTFNESLDVAGIHNPLHLHRHQQPYPTVSNPNHNHHHPQSHHCPKTKESSSTLPSHLASKYNHDNSDNNGYSGKSTDTYKPSTSYKVLKYFVFSYMVLILIIEVAWAVYSSQGLKRDLQEFVDAGDLDQTYMREFYKSTKNFFMFNLILIFLSICIGCAAVGTENKQLLLAFMVIFGIEWVFEVIGVYNSGDRNVVIYRMIPALLRPGLIVSSVIFMRVMSKAEHLKTLNSIEEGNNAPNPVNATIEPTATASNGHFVPHVNHTHRNHNQEQQQCNHNQSTNGSKVSDTRRKHSSKVNGAHSSNDHASTGKEAHHAIKVTVGQS